MLDNTHLITLSMPVYNVEKYVEKSLLSALNQTYKNIEYIIVDDKGDDKSMDIVRQIIMKHQRGKEVKIIEHENNTGLGAGRNSAIEHAKGDYIFFMDSDDEISPDCIKKLYDNIQKQNADFAVGSCRRLSRTGQIIKDEINTDLKICGYMEVARQFFEQRNKSLTVFTWNKLYRMSFLRDNRILCNPAHLNEDNIFSFQVFLNAFSCSLIHDITYFYYETPDSIMYKIQNKNISPRFATQYTEIGAFYREYMQNYRYTDIYESIIEYVINNEYFHAVKVSNSLKICKSEKRKFIKSIAVFPLNFGEIGKLKKKKLFFYLMWLIFKAPFKIPLFKLILRTAGIKKQLINSKYCKI
ncbi:MAG: glycosyltransferase [Prevotellaceae bacterium]|jgi:glycosyltransferase involved in cell wall biosynthesis|nr:glycosyltransferase [Prevotellaceae bacterium]